MSWEAEQHREWHRLNGPPESTVCPWDCYDPPEPERCVICAEYLHADEPCSNAEKDWHIEALAVHQGLVLQARARQMQREAELAAEDPWF